MNADSTSFVMSLIVGFDESALIFAFLPSMYRFLISLTKSARPNTVDPNLNRIFKESGAVHGCALCQDVDILMFVEDVGRHNAADAISGRMWLERIVER